MFSTLPSKRNAPGGARGRRTAVADTSAVLIYSAHLTEYALNLNTELGLLVRDGTFSRACGGASPSAGG